MEPDLRQFHGEILIVSAPNWLGRIAESLALDAPVHCPSVFEAVAQAAMNQKKEIGSAVLIFIDSLDALEMEAFETLAAISLATTWAVTSRNQPDQHKIRVAQTHEVVGCATLKEHCPELARLREWLHAEPERVKAVELPEKPAPVIHERKPPAATEELVVEKKPEQPEAKEELELLTDEELEALLGTTEPDTF